MQKWIFNYNPNDPHAEMNRCGCFLNSDSPLGNAFHPFGMFMNVKEMLRYKRPFPGSCHFNSEMQEIVAP